MTKSLVSMKDHYSQALETLLSQGILKPDMRILVGCGEERDKRTLLQAGFSNVTISNLDCRLHGTEFAPYAWSFQDVENLAFGDNEFDFCIVHDGLHHCRSPHRGLLELYRVARKGVLVFEPRDTLLARLGVRLNFGQEYEVAAVFDNDKVFGGVRNTAVPNYIYRWTEREIEKAICSNTPWGRHRFMYFYEMRIPWDRLRLLKSRFWYFAMLIAQPILKVLLWLFPRQTNTFGFAVIKPDPIHDLHPWIEQSADELRLNESWCSTRYAKKDSVDRL